MLRLDQVVQTMNRSLLSCLRFKGCLPNASPSSRQARRPGPEYKDQARLLTFTLSSPAPLFSFLDQKLTCSNLPCGPTQYFDSRDTVLIRDTRTSRGSRLTGGELRADLYRKRRLLIFRWSMSCLLCLL